MNRFLTSFVIFFSGLASLNAQQVPSAFEGIDYISTFSKQAAGTWGDDDHVQTYFFAIPVGNQQSFFIRVFDPNVGGKCDQINSAYNSKTSFTVYCGKGCYSDKAARTVNPEGNYKSGIMRATKTFGNESTYDSSWYTFGPFNPQEGEKDDALNAYVFKIIVEGLDGDDGNMYRFFLSALSDRNKTVEGGNAFAYEISFRMKNGVSQVSHLYPFVDKNVISVQQNNFDFDGDGTIRFTTVEKKAHNSTFSGDGVWASGKIIITQAEQNTSVDLQLIKNSSKGNDVTFFVTNQYQEAIPFFSVPIGGLPKYKYKIDVQYRF
ncbi:MAG: hypothetical protein ACRC3B_08075 [Bacteroidia bacterium]